MATIVQTDGILGGVPRIDGTRIGVLDIHEFVTEGDHDPADVADQFDLSLEAVYTALAYYHANPEEMREARRANEAAESTLAERAVTPPKTAE